MADPPASARVREGDITLPLWEGRPEAGEGELVGNGTTALTQAERVLPLLCENDSARRKATAFCREQRWLAG